MLAYHVQDTCDDYTHLSLLIYRGQWDLDTSHTISELGVDPAAATSHQPQFKWCHIKQLIHGTYPHGMASVVGQTLQSL